MSEFGCCPSCGEPLPETEFHPDAVITWGPTLYGYMKGGKVGLAPGAQEGADRIGIQYQDGEPNKVLFPNEGAASGDMVCQDCSRSTTGTCWRHPTRTIILTYPGTKGR